MNYNEVIKDLETIRDAMILNGFFPHTADILDRDIAFLIEQNNKPDTSAEEYDGPTLHELIDKIILGAGGPISTAEIVLALIENADPLLFTNLGEDLAFIQANKEHIDIEIIDPDPVIITRHIATADNQPPVDDEDDLVLIEPGLTLFDLAADIIEEADGPISVTELVTQIFMRGNVSLFEGLANERGEWEDEGRPALTWEPALGDFHIAKLDETTQPAAEETFRVADKTVPLSFLLETFSIYGQTIAQVSNDHTNPVVKEAVHAVAFAIECVTEALRDAVANAQKDIDANA